MALAVQAISEELGVTIGNQSHLDEVAKGAEEYITGILELANRLRKHKIAKVLRVNDINEALTTMSAHPLYGYKSNKVPSYRSVGILDEVEILANQDRQLPLNEIIASSLQNYPIETSFSFHWLAINGIQPRIKENCSDTKTRPISSKLTSLLPEQTKFTDQPVTVISTKLMVSSELQKFYHRCIGIINKQINETEQFSPEFKSLIKTLTTDASLQPLLPFFLKDMVTNPTIPFNISLLILEALFSNENVDCEPYLQYFISIVIANMTFNSISDDVIDSALSMRRTSANFLSIIIKKFSRKYPDLEMRITEKLAAHLLFPRVMHPLSLYGAVLGLQIIDKSLIRSAVIPHIDITLQTVKGFMNHEKFNCYPHRASVYHLHSELLNLCSSCYAHDIASGKTESELVKTYSKVMQFFGSDFVNFSGNIKNPLLFM